jgi:hypothetical protein
MRLTLALLMFFSFTSAVSGEKEHKDYVPDQRPFSSHSKAKNGSMPNCLWLPTIPTKTSGLSEEVLTRQTRVLAEEWPFGSTNTRDAFWAWSKV